MNLIAFLCFKRLNFVLNNLQYLYLYMGVLNGSTLDIELLKLKNRIKKNVRDMFQEIYFNCQIDCFDKIWGDVLEHVEQYFLIFTANENTEWCKKHAQMFEFGFDCVLYTMYNTTNDINIETLELYTDYFFKKQKYDEIL